MCYFLFPLWYPKNCLLFPLVYVQKAQLFKVKAVMLGDGSEGLDAQSDCL